MPRKDSRDHRRPASSLWRRLARPSRCRRRHPTLADRLQLPVGALFCVIDGQTRGRAWSATAARVALRQLALKSGVRRRFAPHQLRHAHAVELMHEGIPLPLIQRQLGHSHLSTTGTYLQGINTEEIISTVHARRAPMMHASAGLAL
jgi:site-specific recombinase XerD